MSGPAPAGPTLEVLDNRLLSFSGQLRNAASQLVRKTALDIQARARSGAPVDTGFLRGSIELEHAHDLLTTVYVAAHYGAHVEYGTTRTPAQPFMHPAVDAVAPGFRAAAEALTRRAR